MVPNGWERANFGQLAEFRNGLNFTKADQGEAIKIVGVSDFKDHSSLSSLDSLDVINVGNSVKENDLIKSGDVLYVRSNGNKDLIGRCLFFPEVTEKFSFSGFTIRGRVTSKHILPSYLAVLSRSEIVKQQFSKNGGGTNISNLSQQILNDVVIPLPPIEEQQKIAKILSTWDKAIATTEKLIATSQQQKKALMQQLLTGKKRLGRNDGSINYKKTKYGKIPSDWDYPAMKDISKQITKKNTEGQDLPVLSCSKHDGFVDSLKYFKKKVYSDDTSGYRIIPRHCFGFPSNHIEEGSIGLQDIYEQGIVSPIYVVFSCDKKRVNNSFLYAMLKTEHYRQIFCAATNASVDRRGSLRWKEFSDIHVPLPSLEEQRKIASVLTAADKEIELLQAKLAHLKDEKKALMQQLLTGKRRVKVEAPEAA